MNVDPMIVVLVGTVAAAAFAFFAAQWWQMRRGYAALSQIEKRRAEVAASRGEVGKQSLRQRFNSEAQRLGIGSNPFPLYAAGVVVYLAAAAPLSAVLPLAVALVAALPAAVFLAWWIIATSARRRRSQFNRQLVDLLDLTVSQIKGGVGAERALQIVAPQMPNPMRDEMTRTLAAGTAGKDLVGAMRELGERYPSRAFEMFLAALEIDRAEGHAIAPALDQAGALLKQDFALAAEAGAKLGQVKAEFYAVAGIVGAIGLYLVLAGGEDMQEAYFSPVGIGVIAVAVGNGAWGFFRFNRKLTSLTGDTK